MKLLALLAALAAAAYYYYLQHPEVVTKYRPAAFSQPAATPNPTPRQHYHSPLDAANGHNSAGFFSSEPSQRYELTGPRATTSTRPTPPPTVDDAP